MIPRDYTNNPFLVKLRFSAANPAAVVSLGVPPNGRIECFRTASPPEDVQC